MFKTFLAFENLQMKQEFYQNYIVVVVYIIKYSGFIASLFEGERVFSHLLIILAHVVSQRYFPGKERNTRNG